MTQPVYPDSYRIYASLNSVWTDLTAYVIGDIDVNWGIEGNDPLDRLAGTGSLAFMLNNESDQFIPDKTGALSGWKKGTQVKLVITYEAEDYIRFLGVVNSIKPGPGLYGYKRVSVKAVDWLEYAANEPVVNPGILTNQTGDAVVQTMLGLMPIQPAATDLDAGVSVFPTTFDTVTSHTKAMAEFGKVALSEPGYIYLRKDKATGETLAFESSHFRSGWKTLSQMAKAAADSGFLLKEDGGYLLKEDGGKIVLNETQEFFANNSMKDLEVEYGERVINRFTIYANPRRLDASAQVLFQLDQPLQIAAGQTVTIKGTYADPAGGLPINGQNMITPAASTDYKVWTNSDGTGTDLTSNLTLISTTYGTEGFTHQVRNDASVLGWVTKYNTRGYGIYNYNPIEHVETDSNSIAEFGTKPESIDQKYQAELLQGTLFGRQVVEEERSERTIVKAMTFIANRSGELMMAFLHGDCGFLFRAANDEKGVDDLFFIQGVTFTIKPGGYIMCKWFMKKIVSLRLGLSEIGVEFPGVHRTVDFGYLSQVVGPAVTQISFSFWIYVADTLSNIYQYIVSPYINGGGGLLIYFFTDNFGQHTIFFQSSRFSGLAGVWEMDDRTILSLNTWYHVAITYEYNLSANPIIYINGVSRTVTEDQTPTGTLMDVRASLTLGAYFNTVDGIDEYQGGLIDGTLKDVRIYDRILSSTEVTDLYNSGTPDETLVTDGLVFQTFCVRTKELSSYEDQTLDESKKILDNIYGAVGTPYNSPVGRSF